jgi:hypothetical protein
VPNAITPREQIPTDPAGLQEFLERAQRGDAATLPALRELFRDAQAVELLGGSLARRAEDSLIRKACGDDLVSREALSRKLELLRAELAGLDPTPVERLLVERVVACWLQVYDADARYAQAKDLSPEWCEYHQRRMDGAHKRYLSAVKTLAVVRKLAVPVLQVNIARKQVNVAGMCPAVEGGG